MKFLKSIDELFLGEGSHWTDYAWFYGGLSLISGIGAFGMAVAYI